MTPDAPLVPPAVMPELRFSLVELMRELKDERASSAFAMERLDQGEIAKLIKARKARREKS